MKTRFDWQLIPSFLAVLQQGSLLGAARQLGSSQPTLGRHISELEQQLGVALFERTGRGLLPTAMALQLAEHAERMAEGAFQLNMAATGSDTLLPGVVRITASQPVAFQLLPPVLSRLRERYPSIRIELVASNTVDNLLQREADIALRMVQPAQASLVARKVAEIGIGAYAHRDYLARCGTPQQLPDLLAHALLGEDQGTTIQRGLQLLGLDVPSERFILRTDDYLVYWATVCSGMGIGFLSDHMARKAPDLLPVLPNLRIPAYPVWLTVHREIRGNRRVRVVYDHLAEDLPLELAHQLAG